LLCWACSIKATTTQETAMTLKLMSSAFEDTSLGVTGTRTDSGNALSVLFDNLQADSQATDLDDAPQLRRAEGTVQCEGQGWVDVLVRGQAWMAGEHDQAQVMGWVNGRRLRATASGHGEPFSASVSARVGAAGRLRMSLLLLAQRDLHNAGSGALCAVDSIDITVRPTLRQRPTTGSTGSAT
jgi:hypothetical protein